MPGLLRARRRQRSGQRADQGGARRGRVGGDRAEGVDLAGPPVRLVLRGLPHRAGVGAPQGPLLPAGPHGPARHRGPTHHPAHPDLRVQRGLLRRCPHRGATTWSGRWATGGGWPWPPWPSSGASASSATSSRSAGSSTSWSTVARGTGRASDPVVRQRLARSYAELEILRFNTLRSLSGYDGPVAPPEASIIKLYWASWHRRFGELAIDVRGAPATLVASASPTSSTSSSAPSCSAGRRPSTAARTRSRRTSSASGSSACRPNRRGPPMTDSATDPPAGDRCRRFPSPPAGHGLLAGKVVVITAAAGTGIGFATAKRCVEEGATVVVSDAHERRLGEAADALAALPELDGRAPAGRALQRDRGVRGPASLRRRRRAPRSLRRGRQQRRPRGAGRRGGHDRRAVVDRSST